MRLNLSVVIVHHVSFFVYSNILEVQDLFPCHFTLGRDFNMIPRQKGDQRWENFNVHRKYMKKEKVLMFFYFFYLISSLFSFHNGCIIFSELRETSGETHSEH